MISNLPELAEYIAEYLSRDANLWPSAQVVDRPLRMAFVCEDESAWYAAPLHEAWGAILSQGYTADGGRTLELARQDQLADATIHFRERRHEETQDSGLAYDLKFAKSPEVYVGWFCLPISV
jgi:hypothetical protein